MFTPRACLFCDDIFAEVADVCFMDAWLPEIDDGGRGTSIVLVRSPDVLNIFSAARQDGSVVAKPLTIDRVIVSQAGLVEEKKVSLGHRLAIPGLSDGAPRKRVSPRRPPLWIRRLCWAREKVRAGSHLAWASSPGPDSFRFRVFESSMEPARNQLARCARVARFLSRLSRLPRSLGKKLGAWKNR